jgi:hypothetical protein
MNKELKFIQIIVSRDNTLYGVTTEGDIYYYASVEDKPGWRKFNNVNLDFLDIVNELPEEECKF